MNYAKTLEEYFSTHEEWKDALFMLRKLFQGTELDESLKWGVPVYSLDGKNIAGLAAFKGYVGIWFYNGVFLKDEQQKLINAQEGKTQALRQWRFASAAEIDLPLVAAYVEEAIQNQKDGKEFKPEKKILVVPELLQTALKQDDVLNSAFQALGLSKQREFTEYISDAKRDETKQKRLEKILPMIRDGVGLNDKYK